MSDNFRFLDEYRVQQELEGRVSQATLDIYMGEISDFLYSLRDEELEETDLVKAMRYIESLRESFAPHSIKRRLVSLNSFFKFLLKKGIIKNNPFEEIRVEAQVRDESPKLTQGEIRRVMDFCKDDPKGFRDRVIISLLFQTGLKINDVLNIRIEEVINPREIITLKKSGLLKIQVEGESSQLLKEYLELYRGKIEEESERLLFKNLSRQNFRARFMKYCKNAGVKGEISPIEIKKRGLEERRESTLTKEALLQEIKREYMKIGIGDD